MTLLDDWKAILKKAWSVRFNALATVLTGADIMLQTFKPEGAPNVLFAVLAGVATMAAMVARVVAQKEIGSGAVQ